MEYKTNLITFKVQISRYEKRKFTETKNLNYDGLRFILDADGKEVSVSWS